MLRNFAVRNGNTIIDIASENDIVAVLRRINPGPSLNEFVRQDARIHQDANAEGRARQITSLDTLT